MEHVTFGKFLKKLNGLDRLLAGFLFVGLMITLTSFFRGIVLDRQAKVEYISGDSVVLEGDGSKVFVDIEGGVIKPGVYEMMSGSRVKDVLVMAGGLSDDADRLYCEKNLNMAQEVVDGQKIYIPRVSSTNAQLGYPEAILKSNKINVNTASMSELDTLWGIGSAKAEAIVKSRPYQSLEELVTKGVISKSLLERNIEMMSVF